MLKQFIDDFKHINEKIFKIMKCGLIFSLQLAIFSSLLLLTYMIFYSNPILFDIGIALYRFSSTIAVEFVICAFVVDILKKQGL